jgi:hypothetical protein
MNNLGSIIESNIYNDLSLKDHLTEICNPKVIVTYQDIVNVLLKFFFWHRYTDSIDVKVPLWEIEELFSIAELYFKSSKIKEWFILSTSNTNVWGNIKHLQWSGYWLAMLWDASPSIAIFKNIIDNNIDIEKFDKKYFWLDLWTGSWWLLLAQYVQAIRNGFTDIENYGIEINDTSALASNIIISKLQIGSIITWDTTDINTYLKLPQDRLISHISNENIPTNWVSMCGINDPFHQNNIALFWWSLKSKITEYTNFFPNKIEMLLDLWDQFKRPMMWEKTNAFWFADLLEFEKILKQAEKDWKMTLGVDDKWNIFHSVYPLWIDIGNNKITRLDEVWEEFLQSWIKKWLVNRLPWWRKRWEKEVKK